MRSLFSKIDTAVKGPSLLFILSVLSSPAWSQEVTLEELVGAVINVSAVHQEKIIREGQIRYPQLRTVGQITFGPDHKLRLHFQHSSGGKTKTNFGTKTIGKPGKDAEGNDVVWVFSGGNLTRLSVFPGAGGQKITIAFTRGPDGLSCTFSRPLAPETGVGKIHKPSTIDGKPIQILEFKELSSSCHVAKR